ncbi:MAG: RHS repeat-associated core domain-containing protein, partial [Nitrospira sp.]|nr:RHS repeat-associated core domain-containing protein [Nitrospira sp.]
GTPPSQALTDQGFTGHKHNDDLKLIYMNARFYVPSLNRFISADTIVPNPQNPQSFNRYSYAYNNPVNFADPSGHNPAWCNDPYDAGGGANCAPLVDFTVASGTEVTWTFAEESEVRLAAALIDFKLMLHGSSFLKIYGDTVTFKKTGEERWNLGYAEDQNLILVNEQEDGATVTSLGGTWVAHELGHAFDKALHPNTTDHRDYGQGTIDLATSDIEYTNARGVDVQIAGGCNTGNYLTSCYIRNDAGYVEQHNTSPSPMEDFADMFSGYIYGFTPDSAGQARYDWMDSHMSAWISLAVTNNNR